MKCQVPVIVLNLVGLSHQVAHAEKMPVECFSSPEAVHEAHRGSRAMYTTHATWWSESSKCWFADEPTAKPKTNPRAAATVAPASSLDIAQTLPPPPKQEVPVALEESVAARETYEESAVALRALMFGEDEASTNFEGRFSAIGNTLTFDFSRRCFDTPVWICARVQGSLEPAVDANDMSIGCRATPRDRPPPASPATTAAC
jgi:hypothetical protein